MVSETSLLEDMFTSQALNLPVFPRGVEIVKQSCWNTAAPADLNLEDPKFVRR